MTEHNDLTEQSPDRKPREELDSEAMGQPGMSDDAAAVVSPEAGGAGTSDDGVPVGSADVDADRERSGAE